MGPLATADAKTRFTELLERARGEGARVLVESESIDGGAFVSPELYEVTGDEPFLREELFGPHISFECASDEPDAFERAANTPYGLSAALFSASPERLEDFMMWSALGSLTLIEVRTARRAYCHLAGRG